MTSKQTQWEVEKIRMIGANALSGKPLTTETLANIEAAKIKFYKKEILEAMSNGK